MNSVSKMALAVGFALAGASSTLLAPAEARKEAAPAAPHLSKPVLDALSAGQAALDAGDTATASARAAAATAAATSAEDRFYTAQLQYQVAIKAGDRAGQTAAAEAMVASGGAPADARPQLLRAGAVAASNVGNYAKAEDYLGQLVQLAPSDIDAQIALAEAQYRNGRNADALATAEKAIAAKKASGAAVEQSWYQRPLDIAYEAKMVPDEAHWSELLLGAYPTPQNWRTTLTLFRDANKPDDQVTLDLFRLQRAAGALKGERDFTDYAKLANASGLPGEAKAVLDEGVAAHVIDPKTAELKALIAVVAAKARTQKAGLAAADAKARTTSDAKSALNAATAHFGYGEYAKAAELIRVALEKPGVDGDAANTRLGIALAMSNQKDEALKAFASVTGGARAQIAHYWSIWAAARS